MKFVSCVIMKRITYISKLSAPLSINEVENLGDAFTKKNKENNITGVLIFIRGIFFQLIEGQEDKIDELYNKIKYDPRHTEVVCLKTEYDAKERLFPEWSMKTINLDENTSEIMRPLRILLQNVMESHSIILQYTQPAVLNIFNSGLNPLESPLVKTEKVILFGDIVSFSNICENKPVEEISEMLNFYLELCSGIIAENGGEVTKYLGDGLMAFFNIEFADQALQACVHILEELAHEKEIKHSNSLITNIITGFGLSAGVVMEGNIGSSLKKDYTVIGDPVNTAARLEAHTRKVNKAIVLTENVKKLLRSSWDLTLLGEVALKGKQKKVKAYAPEIPLK